MYILKILNYIEEFIFYNIFHNMLYYNLCYESLTQIRVPKAKDSNTDGWITTCPEALPIYCLPGVYCFIYTKYSGFLSIGALLITQSTATVVFTHWLLQSQGVFIPLNKEI